MSTPLVFLRLSQLVPLAMLLAWVPLSLEAQEIQSPTEAPTTPSPPTPPASDLRLMVLQKGTGKPLGRAEVQIDQQVYFTDPQGAVLLPSLADGVQIMISKKGFEKQIIAAGSLRQGNPPRVFLAPGQPDDEEIVIKGNKRPAASQKTILVEETKRIAPGGDPVQITKLLPGVQSSTFSNEVVIRGSGPNDSRYYIDDIQVPIIFHPVGNISIVPDQLLSDVEFYTGGFGAQYGEVTGGIIALNTTSEIPADPMTEFKLNVPFFNALYHERPLSEDSALALSVRKSSTEYILPAIIPKDLGLTLVPYFGDAHIRYLKKYDDGYSKLTVVGSVDGAKLAAPFDASDREDGKINVDFANKFYVLGWERRKNLGAGWTLSTTPQFFYFYQEFQIQSDFLRGHVAGYRLPASLSKRLNANQNLQMGLLPSVYNAKFKFEAPVPDPSDPYFDFEDAPRSSLDREYWNKDVAAWVSLDQKIGTSTITPGLRVYHRDQLAKTAIDPRLIFRSPLTDIQTLKGAVGQYTQPPEGGETAKGFGNPDLLNEVSNHYILGLEQKWNDRWNSEVQVFQKRIYHLITPDAADEYKSVGTRTANGFELFVRRNMTEKFFGWLAYTYSKVREREDDQSPMTTSPYDETHIVNLAGSYKLTPLWDLGLRFKYNTGSPYTPITGSVYNASLDKYQPLYDTEHPYSDRLPDFHTLDLFATYDSLYDTWKLAYRFGVQYLALQRRISSYQYNYDYSEKEPVQDLPPIPYIEIRGTF